MTIVKSYCGCCDLRTGTLVVGIFGLISTAIALIADTSDLDELENEILRTSLKTGFGYMYISVIIDGLLIYGALKDSRYFLLPWLIYTAIGLGLASFVLIILAFYEPVFFLAVLAIAGLWYVWTCVLSLFQELDPTNTDRLPPGYAATFITAAQTPTYATYDQQPPTYKDLQQAPSLV